MKPNELITSSIVTARACYKINTKMAVWSSAYLSLLVTSESEQAFLLVSALLGGGIILLARSLGGGHIAFLTFLLVVAAEQLVHGY